MEFDEKSLRKGIQFGLGSQGIWTPELEDVMFEEIKNQALSQHDVSGMLKSFVSYAESRSISDININDDTIEYFIEDFNLR